MTIEALKNCGVNVEEGLSRCLNNEAFYLKMIHMGLADGHFAKLEEAIAAHNLDEAFENAHALKGVVGNLALTPLAKPISEITELLRARTDIDYSALCAEISARRSELCALEQ